MTNLIACVHSFMLMLSINFQCHNCSVNTCPDHYSMFPDLARVSVPLHRSVALLFFPPASRPQPPRELDATAARSTRIPRCCFSPVRTAALIGSNGGGASSLPRARLRSIRCLGFLPLAASSNPGDGGSDPRSNLGGRGSDSLRQFFAPPYRSPHASPVGRSIATSTTSFRFSSTVPVCSLSLFSGLSLMLRSNGSSFPVRNWRLISFLFTVFTTLC